MILKFAQGSTQSENSQPPSAHRVAVTAALSRTWRGRIFAFSRATCRAIRTSTTSSHADQ